MSFSRGLIGEELWVEYLDSKGHDDVELSPKGKVFYEYDVSSNKNGKRFTYEVKYDSKAYMWAERRKTPDNPNLYIEFQNTKQGKDSGILMSEADFYVYMIVNKEVTECYVFNRDLLLSHLINSSYKKVGNSSYGDNNAKGWIPPLSKLKKTDSFVYSINII